MRRMPHLSECEPRFAADHVHAEIADRRRGASFILLPFGAEDCDFAGAPPPVAGGNPPTGEFNVTASPSR